MAHTDGIKTVKANLQTLVKTITGHTCTRQTVSGVIQELNDNWSGSNELPAWTSTDAGKVLAVNTAGTALEWKTLG